MNRKIISTAILAIAMISVQFTKATAPVFYGLTSSGGANGYGTIFTYYQGISPSSMVVYSFDSVNSGATPLGSLIQASDGNLYGLTLTGGVNGLGTIFQYNPTTNTFTKKQDFGGSANPSSSFFQASDGNLYATTLNGGAGSLGSIIKYNITTNTVTDVHDFAGQPNDGGTPSASFTENNGILYSTTNIGGANNLGTYIFNQKLVVQ